MPAGLRVMAGLLLAMALSTGLPPPAGAQLDPARRQDGPTTGPQVPEEVCDITAGAARLAFARAMEAAIEANPPRLVGTTDGESEDASAGDAGAPKSTAETGAETLVLAPRSRQTTEVLLGDSLRLRPEGPDVCVRYPAPARREDALARLGALEEELAADLPSGATDRRDAIASRLRAIDGLVPLLASVAPDIPARRARALLNAREELARELGRVLAGEGEQGVILQVRGAYRAITLNTGHVGVSGRLIPLEAGEHVYRISGPDHCPAQGLFEVAGGQVREIEVPMAPFRLPRVRFTTNRPAAVISVAGETIDNGQVLSFPRCNGSVAYRFSYEGQVREGRVTLRPGLNTTIERDFDAAAGRTNRARLARAYGNARQWRLQGAIVSPALEVEADRALAGATVQRVRSHRYTRFGGALLYAQSDGAAALEAYAPLRLQVTRLEGERVPLALGPVILIPALGVDVGVGGRWQGERQIGYARERVGGSPAPWQQAIYNNLVLRPMAELDVSFNRNFAVSAAIGRSLFIDRAVVFTAGVTINLPRD